MRTDKNRFKVQCAFVRTLLVRVNLIVFLLYLSFGGLYIGYKGEQAIAKSGWLKAKIEVCGKERCNTREFKSPGIPEPAGGYIGDMDLSHLAPSVAPYYKVITHITGAEKQYHYIVPSSKRILWGLLDAKIWTQVSSQHTKLINLYLKIANSPPYPKPIPKEVRIDGKAVSDPRPYIGVFGLSSNEVSTEQLGNLPTRKLEIIWNEENPWAGTGEHMGEGTKTELVLVGSSYVRWPGEISEHGSVEVKWPDGFTARIPASLEKVVKKDISEIKEGGSGLNKGLYVAAAVLAALVIAAAVAASLMRARPRPSG